MQVSSACFVLNDCSSDIRIWAPVTQEIAGNLLDVDQAMPTGLTRFAGGALSFSCGLHIGSPVEGTPTCLVIPGGSLQDGKLQWPAEPVRFFVSGAAVKSLKVNAVQHIYCGAWAAMCLHTQQLL